MVPLIVAFSVETGRAFAKWVRSVIKSKVGSFIIYYLLGFRGIFGGGARGRVEGLFFDRWLFS